LINALIRGNKFGIGVFYSNASAPVLTNVSIIDNGADTGGAFAVFTTYNAKPLVRNSVLSNNGWQGETAGNGETTLSASVVNGPLFSAVTDETVMQTDPGLDTEGRPLPGSPVIDAGINSALPSGITLDLAGEPRFVDDPDTPDTGQGVEPIVDLGAFEFQVDVPQSAECVADMNGSGFVDTADLGILLGSFGETVTPMSRGDMNGDGLVDTSDLSMLIGMFGAACD